MPKPNLDAEVKPITEAEIDIFMCRLQNAVWEEDREKIDKIIEEIKARVKEVESDQEKNYGEVHT